MMGRALHQETPPYCVQAVSEEARCPVCVFEVKAVGVELCYAGGCDDYAVWVSELDDV